MLLARLSEFNVVSNDSATPGENLSTFQRGASNTDDTAGLLESLSTPNLMKKAEQFFSDDMEETPSELCSALPSSVLPNSAATPLVGSYLSKFVQIMKKYEMVDA